MDVCVCLFLTGDFALSGLVGRRFVYVYMFLTRDIFIFSSIYAYNCLSLITVQCCLSMLI